MSGAKNVVGELETKEKANQRGGLIPRKEKEGLKRSDKTITCKKEKEYTRKRDHARQGKRKGESGGATTNSASEIPKKKNRGEMLKKVFISGRKGVGKRSLRRIRGKTAKKKKKRSKRGKSASHFGKRGKGKKDPHFFVVAGNARASREKRKNKKSGERLTLSTRKRGKRSEERQSIPAREGE